MRGCCILLVISIKDSGNLCKKLKIPNPGSYSKTFEICWQERLLLLDRYLVLRGYLSRFSTWIGANILLLFYLTAATESKS